MGQGALGVLAVVLGFLLSTIGAMGLLILNDMRRAIRDLDKHQRGILNAMGPIMWRLVTMEEWLERKFDYHPPRNPGGPDVRL